MLGAVGIQIVDTTARGVDFVFEMMPIAIFLSRSINNLNLPVHLHLPYGCGAGAYIG